jgi:hypothetical protein
MKRAFLVLGIVAVVGPLVIKGIAYEQVYVPATGLDMSRIAIDPVTNEPALLLKLQRYAGQPVTIVGVLRDEDNEPNAAEPNYPPQSLSIWRDTPSGRIDLPFDAAGAYQFTVTYTDGGWHYEQVAWTDGIATMHGTVAIHTRVNHRPVNVCGGQP